MSVGRFEEVTDFVENLITAYTGGTLALLSSCLGVFLPETLEGLLLRFALTHDGNVMHGFDVIVELVLVLGEFLDILDRQAVEGDTVFTGEGHLITGKRLLLYEEVLAFRYRHSTASRSALVQPRDSAPGPLTKR